MANLTFFEQDASRQPWQAWLRESAYGFLYWLAFLLVLEPANVLHAVQAGQTLAFLHEASRIVIASALGCSVTPVLLMLTRRYPVFSRAHWPQLLLHLGATVVLAFVLILVSCFLAAWVYGPALPTMSDIRDQLTANWLLLVYAQLAFVAIAHVVYLRRSVSEPVRADTPPQTLTRLPIKARGGNSYLDLARIDWIESQGNYLALHAGAEVHLIRETLVNLEAQLDASQFVRIHRSAIVAIDRIRGLQPVANGDAILLLAENRELRASRRYRDAIRERWQAAGQI